jgi:AcrR family transcriptional regulator
MDIDRSGTPDRPPRDRILDAASELFAEVGFAGARVDEIAARASVNKAMLYYYVGDKQALYTAILLRNFDRVAAALAGAVVVEGTARQRLEAVIRAITEVIQRHPEHPRIMLREVASGASNLPDEVLDRMLEVVEVVRGLLLEGSRHGEFRPTQPWLTHLAIVGAVLFVNAVAPLIERAANRISDADLPDPAVDISTALGHIFLDGIAAPANGGLS